MTPFHNAGWEGRAHLEPLERPIELAGAEHAVAVRVQGGEGLPQRDVPRLEHFHHKHRLRSLLERNPLGAQYSSISHFS